MDNHIEIISSVIKEIKSHILANSHIQDTTLNSGYIRGYFNLNYEPLISKLHGTLTQTNPNITIDQINNLVTSSSLIVTDSNYIEVLNILFKAFNTFS